MIGKLRLCSESEGQRLPDGGIQFSLSRLRAKSDTIAQKMLAENGSSNAPLKLEGYGNSG